MSAGEPAFVDVGGRSLFVVRHPPQGPVRCRVLVLPPFAEEANRCRRLTALTARALAAAGCETLVFDLSGTGDSAGDFAAADWQTWCDDVRGMAAQYDWSRATGRRAVLAVRSGLLLAPALDLADAALVAWQPVLNGERFLQQFLRTRVMAAKFAGRNESVKELLERFRTGEALEVAGYTLSPALALALAAARVDAAGLAELSAATLLECKPQGGGEPSAPVAALAQALHAQGRAAAAEVLAAEAFWSTQEISAPGVIVSRTVAALGDGGAAR